MFSWSLWWIDEFLGTFNAAESAITLPARVTLVASFLAAIAALCVTIAAHFLTMFEIAYGVVANNSGEYSLGSQIFVPICAIIQHVMWFYVASYLFGKLVQLIRMAWRPTLDVEFLRIYLCKNVACCDNCNCVTAHDRARYCSVTVGAVVRFLYMTLCIGIATVVYLINVGSSDNRTTTLSLFWTTFHTAALVFGSVIFIVFLLVMFYRRGYALYQAYLSFEEDMTSQQALSSLFNWVVVDCSDDTCFSACPFNTCVRPRVYEICWMVFPWISCLVFGLSFSLLSLGWVSTIFIPLAALIVQKTVSREKRLSLDQVILRGTSDLSSLRVYQQDMISLTPRGLVNNNSNQQQETQDASSSAGGLLERAHTMAKQREAESLCDEDCNRCNDTCSYFWSDCWRRNKKCFKHNTSCISIFLMYLVLIFVAGYALYSTFSPTGNDFPYAGGEHPNYRSCRERFAGANRTFRFGVTEMTYLAHLVYYSGETSYTSMQPYLDTAFGTGFYVVHECSDCNPAFMAIADNDNTTVFAVIRGTYSTRDVVEDLLLYGHIATFESLTLIAPYDQWWSTWLVRSIMDYAVSLHLAFSEPILLGSLRTVRSNVRYTFEVLDGVDTFHSLADSIDIKRRRLFLVGHSLGGALAHLAAGALRQENGVRRVFSVGISPPGMKFSSVAFGIENDQIEFGGISISPDNDYASSLDSAAAVVHTIKCPSSNALVCHTSTQTMCSLTTACCTALTRANETYFQCLCGANPVDCL